MAYIFLDESGDLGFKKASSRWFIFTLAITNDQRALERIAKKVWRSLIKKHKHLGELHASYEKKSTIKKVLKLVAELPDIQILTIILNKKKVYVDLQNQKNYLYNYAANILLNRVHTKDIVKMGDPMELFIDRKDTKKWLRENFINYLTDSMKKRRGGRFSVELHSSHDNKSLQVIDFISWAIFRKYERSDQEYYDLIRAKIVEESVLFP